MEFNPSQQPKTRESTQGKVVSAEEILSKAQELAMKTSFLLSEDIKLAEKYFPLDEISKLSTEEVAQVATTYGRILFFNTHRSRFPEWSEKIEAECDALLRNSSDDDRENVGIITGKIAGFSELLMAGEINTNSAGSSTARQDAMREYFGQHLKATLEKDAYGGLYNPFHLKDGVVLFRPKLDDKEEFLLEEIQIGDVVLDGKDSAVDIGGETIPLANLNRDLARGNLMLRDGSNILGKKETAYEFPVIKKGEMISVAFMPSPFQENNIHTVEFLGTNGDDLRARYGDAYLPFIKKALIIKFRFNGEERSVPLSDIVEILDSK